MAETAKKTHVQTALKHKWNPMHNMANDFHKKQPTISLCPEGPGAIAPGPSGLGMATCYRILSAALTSCSSAMMARRARNVSTRDAIGQTPGHPGTNLTSAVPGINNKAKAT